MRRDSRDEDAEPQGGEEFGVLIVKGLLYGFVAMTSYAVTTIVTSAASAFMKTRHATEIAAIKAELDLFKKQIDALIKELEKASNRVDTLSVDISKKRERLERLLIELTEFKKQCAEETAACDQLITVITSLRQQILQIENSNQAKTPAKKLVA